MRSPVFRRPGCRRHAGTTKRRPQYATPEVVAGRHCTTRLCFTPLTHKVIHVKPRREHSPAPPPGCDCVQERFGTPRMSPRPRVAKYGVSHGANHLRGWRNARLRSSSRCVGRCAASAEGHNVACLIVTTLHLRSCAGVGEVPPKTACQRYAQNPTIPPRHYTHRRIHDA